MLKLKSLNKKGFGHVEMIVFAVVVLAIGGIGYYALKGSKAETPAATSSSTVSANKGEYIAYIAKKELGVKEPSEKICAYHRDRYMPPENRHGCGVLPWAVSFAKWTVVHAYNEKVFNKNLSGGSTYNVNGILTVREMLAKAKSSDKWIAKKIDKNTQLVPGDVVLYVKTDSFNDQKAGIVKTFVKSGNNKGMLTVIRGDYDHRVKEHVCSIAKGTCGWTDYLRHK